jgi:hypothetical protein
LRRQRIVTGNSTRLTALIRVRIVSGRFFIFLSGA